MSKVPNMFRTQAGQQKIARQAGFTLLELMIALGVFAVVSAIVLTFMFQMARTQARISNRTDMHSSVRSATEVLQQEISQAGRIAIVGDDSNYPNSTTISVPITAGAGVQIINVGSSAGMFQGMLLVVSARGSGGTCPVIAPATCDEEVVQLTASPGLTNLIQAIFTKNHGTGARIWPSGAAVTGILPTSTGTKLQMFGDVNDDGKLVFVQYDCVPDGTGTGTLRRREMPWNTTVADANDAGGHPQFQPQTLLNRLWTNPPQLIAGTWTPVPCFSYQTKAASWTALDGSNTVATAYVNVAITMTARTELVDPISHTFDNFNATTHTFDSQNTTETKALLTVSPRNAFQAWEMSTMPGSAGQHVQPTPPEVATLAAGVL
jgi:prepilin-type N-terminal cleavage/methylation domain-containing protein